MQLRKILMTLLLCLACLGLGAGGALYYMEQGTVYAPEVPPVVEPAAPVYEDPAEEEELPVPALTEREELVLGEQAGELYISDARRTYASGDLRLVIPKLHIDIPILNGVSAATLQKGEGLYPQSQLPSEENGNVSIAGHRNGVRNGIPVATRPFYYVNTLGEGDYLYLTDRDHIYQYRWECTEEILPSNWGPIANQGYSCLTLTTCTPIGIADHRLVVRGRLVNTLDADSAYPFPVNISEG